MADETNNSEENTVPTNEGSAKAKVVVDSPCTTEDSSVTKDTASISIPPQAMDVITQAIASLPNSDLSPSAAKYWASSLDTANKVLMEEGTFNRTISRPDSTWQQKVTPTDGKPMSAGIPKLAESNGGTLTGEAAILKMTAVMGIGAVVQVPFWHSGVWLSLKAPSESDILALLRRISFEKISLGRSTSGMVFSNMSAYTKSFLVNFVLDHVYDCNVKDYTPAILRQVILTTDYPQLLWGILNTMYPKGYPLSQPCVVNMDSCQHVTESRVNIGKLSWVDNSALTKMQTDFMQKRNVKRTLDELKAYREASKFTEAKRIVIHDNLLIDLAVPTLDDLINFGIKWVDGIVDMVEGSFAVDLRGKERNDYINTQSRSMRLRQYSQWITTIYLGAGEDDSVIDDRDTIDLACERLSAEPEVSDLIQKHITEHIENATMCIIGIPNYECPKCGGKQTDIESKYPHLIPLEVEQIFFTLTSQHLHQTLNH